MNGTDITLAGFQRQIAGRYEATDRARGVPRTWMWFIEEVGELSAALAAVEKARAAGEAVPEGVRANVAEEFADVLAWLCTLANISDVELAEAVAGKYPAAGGPEGEK
ncbi:MAG: MazG nucleotide pyrophosphohydrolase domain-containing protein [Phycisphaerae bacterium]